MFALLKKRIMYYVVCIMGFLCIILNTGYLLPTVHAQTSSTPSASQLPIVNSQLSNVSPTSPIYTDLIVHNMFHTFSCLAIGGSVIGQPCLTYQAQKDAQGVIRTVPVLSQVDTSGGLLGTTTSLITALYANPPVRTADYIASVAKGFGFVKEANAQVVGSGEAVLHPILALWQVSRNISYVIMVVIFVVIGLMVMFRQRINPQTVISAQAALPGLVLGLILITFSYFFASLISDTAFIGTNLVGYYFAAAQGPTALADPERTNLVSKISTHSMLSIFSQFVGIITQENASDALDAIYGGFSIGVQRWLGVVAGFISYQFTSQPLQQLPVIGQFVGPIFGLISGLTTYNLPTEVFGLVLSFVAMFALIYQMLQLLLRLVTSYLTIIFLTISAPFHFLASALPGRQGIGNTWFMNLLANILVFPAVLAVFYFVAFLLGQTFGPLKVSDTGLPQQTSIIPVVYAQGTKLVDKTTFPLFGGINLEFIQILLAFGALMALPKIPDLVVKTIGTLGQTGQILGQEISGGIRSGQGYAGRIPSGVSNTFGDTTKGIFGESVYQPDPRNPQGPPIKVTTKKGLISFFK